MNRIFLVFLIGFALVGGSAFGADVRDESIDIFLVLDKSLSMIEEIEAVKDYISDSIIDNIVQPGDYILILEFYGEATNLVSHEITSSADKANIKNKIREIIADGHWTDIGNALDSLNQAVKVRSEKSERRTFLLLITDGIQEAPPDSKYYTPDGSFNHFFLENTKIIQQEGWKIHILGIGGGTAAKEIAQELSGSYAEVPDEPTQEDLEAGTRGFIGTIDVLLSPEIGAIGKAGTGEMGLTIISSGYENIRTVDIESIEAEINGKTYPDIVPDGFSFSISPKQELIITIPIKIEPLPPAGTYKTTLSFYFSGDTVIIPAVFTTETRIKSWFENNLWIIPIFAVILALIIVLYIIIRNRFHKKGNEDKPKISLT